MKRSTYVVAALLALLLTASMFAPTPLLRAAQSSGGAPGCAGLVRAYAACKAHNPNDSRCEHILEQLVAQGCSFGTS
jgi:hypothetical protein